MPFRTKAEKAFDEKLTAALDSRDFDAIELVFQLYGAYLELIDFHVDMDRQEVKESVSKSLDLVRSTPLTLIQSQMH